MNRARLLRLMVLTSAMLIWQTHSEAQECMEEDLGTGPLEVSPADGASLVTLDAPIIVRYGPGSLEGLDIDTAVTLNNVIGAPTPIAGVTIQYGDALIFTPNAPLAPMARFEGIARGRDFELPFAFRTSSALDQVSPKVGELVDLSSSPIEPDDCNPDGGFRVEVTFEPAIDDGSPGSIEYLLYQSRGPSMSAPLLRSRARNFATDQVTMAYVLSPEEASGPICVVVHAIDGVGKIDDTQTPVCFDPVQGNVFEPLCAVGSRQNSPPEAAILLICGIFFRRRMRRSSELLR